MVAKLHKVVADGEKNMSLKMDYVSILVKMLGYQRTSNSHTRICQAWKSWPAVSKDNDRVWNVSSVSLVLRTTTRYIDRYYYLGFLFGFWIFGCYFTFFLMICLFYFLFLCLSVDLHMFDNLCVGCLRKCLKEF